MEILREYDEGDMHVIEYTQDGETVSHRVETLRSEAPEVNQETLIEIKINELRQAFRADLENGFQSDCTGTMKIYPYTQDDKDRMMGILTMQNAGIAFPILWGAKGEQFGPYTLEQFKKLCLDAAIAEQTKLMKISSLENQTRAAQNDEERNAIVY